MAGEFVPVVMAPRFTTYVGAGEFVTAPLDASAFAAAYITFWCGPLVGTTGTPATFEAGFEGSDDGDVWTQILPPFDDVDTHTFQVLPLLHPYLRLRVTLEGDTNDAAAITCWAAGFLEVREP